MTELMKRPNPYWDAVVDQEHQRGRHDLVGQYAWTITDPASVAFVAAHSRGRIVDPMAGTGYWGYVLGFHGVDVRSYDLDSPSDNTFHRNYVLHSPVTQFDGTQAAAWHPDRTLLLAWPPYNMRTGRRIVDVYRGDRIIYIGEGEGGCCGDDDLHQLLEQRWTQVAEHIPVQWEGLHDQITVHDRRPL